MKLTEIQDTAQNLIDQLEKLIKQRVPQKGDKTTDCQYLTLISALRELEYGFDSIEPSDLIPDKDWEFANKDAGFIF